MIFQPNAENPMFLALLPQIRLQNGPATLNFGQVKTPFSTIVRIFCQGVGVKTIPKSSFRQNDDPTAIPIHKIRYIIEPSVSHDLVE